MRRDFYERNRVRIYHGHANFLDAQTLEVRSGYKTEPTVLTADAFVIASGSHPFRPKDIDFNHPRVFDSDTILSMTTTPRSIAICGAGVIGCEYASIFRNMGCKVDLIDTRAQLLSFLDSKIAHALSYHLRDQGVMIHNEDYEQVEGLQDGVLLHLKSGKRIKADVLLWANGRTGNTANMGLEALGIVPNSRGQVKVDDSYRTALPHIYAVGDVIGYPQPG